jgi:NAD(P)-dependent dehydrogenase (short-subunit alcohol dehydrogenase family)
MAAVAKRILVTGGAKRVGRRFVEALSAAGHGVVIHANSNAAEAEELCASLRKSNPNTWAIAADLSDHAAACALVGQASQLAGAPLSGLVNSASVFDYDAPGAMKVDVFEHAMAVNLRAPALLAESFAKQADPRIDNCVVNMLDMKLWAMNPDFYSYTMSKAGLMAATDMMARAFAPAVRVNAIAPGLLLSSYDQTQAAFEKVASNNLMERVIDLGDVTATLEFLMANRSLTGQVIHVDNGQHMISARRDAIFTAPKAGKDGK